MQTTLQSGDIHTSDIFFGQVSQKWVFNVLMPLPFEVGAKQAVLLITTNAEDMRSNIVTEGLSPGWASAVIDGSGNVVATAGQQNTESGEQFPYKSHLPSSLIPGQMSVDETLLAYAPVRQSTWRAVVWGPLTSARMSVFETQMPLLIGGSLLLALAGLSAVVLGKRLRASVEALAMEAKKMGEGDVVPYLNTPIKELNDVSTALTNSSFDRNQAEERLRVLLSEMSHRSKNMMTVIDVLIRQSARRFDVPKGYLDSLRSRLHGLATSIDLLARDNWSGIPFKELVHSQLDKFLYAPDQIELVGEDFAVRPQAVQPLSLAFHELGTNAMKYGALSVSEGRVRVTWSIDRESQSQTLTLNWRETGGPEVWEPTGKGFGSIIISDHLSSSLTGVTRVDYHQDGFQWSLSGPFGAFCDDTASGT